MSAPSALQPRFRSTTHGTTPDQSSLSNKRCGLTRQPIRPVVIFVVVVLACPQKLKLGEDVELAEQLSDADLARGRVCVCAIGGRCWRQVPSGHERVGIQEESRLQVSRATDVEGGG